MCGCRAMTLNAHCIHVLESSHCTHLGVKVWWSDVRFEWGKSRSQHLKWASVDWILLLRVVWDVANDFTVEIYQVTLQRDREGGREREEGREKGREEENHTR